MSHKYQQQHSDLAAPHTGNMLRRHMKATGLNNAEIGRRTNRITSTVRALMLRGSMQTAILWEMCHTMKHNFFADLAAQLPEDYASHVATKQAAEIAELKMQLKVTEEMLEKAIRKGQ